MRTTGGLEKRRRVSGVCRDKDSIFFTDRCAPVHPRIASAFQYVLDDLWIEEFGEVRIDLREMSGCLKDGLHRVSRDRILLAPRNPWWAEKQGFKRRI